MKLYPESALRRAMKVLAVILKAMARAIKWIQAADILGAIDRERGPPRQSGGWRL